VPAVPEKEKQDFYNSDISLSNIQEKDAPGERFNEMKKTGKSLKRERTVLSESYRNGQESGRG